MHHKIAYHKVSLHAFSEFSCGSGLLADRQRKFGIVILFAGIWLCSPLLCAQFGAKEAFFAQFASGGGYRTIFMVHNESTVGHSVDFTLTESSGAVVLNNEIQLQAGATKNVTIEGNGPTKVGWAKLSSKGKFSATEMFQYVDSGGSVISQVGVLPSHLASRFQLFGSVSRSAGTDTGVALANPTSKVANLQIKQLDASGKTVAAKSVQLRPSEHMARFLDEEPFFPGLDNYSGILELTADQPIAAVTLRLDGQQYAALPVVTPSLAADAAVNAFQTEITCKYVKVGHMTGGPIYEATIAVPPGKILVIESVSALGVDNPFIGTVDDTVIETTFNGQTARHKLSTLAVGTQTALSQSLRIYAGPDTTVWITQRLGTSILSVSGFYVDQ